MADGATLLSGGEGSRDMFLPYLLSGRDNFELLSKTTSGRRTPVFGRRAESPLTFQRAHVVHVNGSHAADAVAAAVVHE